MTSKTLSKSEIKEINDKTNKYYGKDFFHKKDFVQLFTEPIKHIKSNKKTYFFIKDDVPIPILKILLKDPFLKKVTVDMGAVKFICNGADVMRPGIVQIDDEIQKNDIIMVVDEKNKTPLVVGRALHSTNEMQDIKEGKAIENLHFISDQIWQLD
ncbi:MAG: PUA domain-containing protein [Candidatus Woesearchaeota archaeon]